MTKNIQTVVKTQRIAITKPISTDWSTFGRIAGDMTHIAIKIMNDAITMHHLHIKEKYDYEDQTGKKMNVKEVYGATYNTIINRTLKEKYKKHNISGDTFEQIVRQAVDTFNTQSKEILNSNASLPSFRRDQPIPVRARALNLNDEYQVYLPLMNAKQAKKHRFTGTRKQSFHVQLDARKNAKVVLDKILSGEFTMADSMIQRTLDGKWFLLLVYNEPVKQVAKDDSVIVGVDLGISKAAYMAVNNSKQNFFIDGGEVKAFRNRIRGRRRSLQNQLRVCSHNRRGHGRKTLLKPLEHLSEKESNFNDLVNHRYSKAIVEWAEKQGAGVIQMEDLSSIKKLRVKNNQLSNWTYFDLATKIEYKARQKGIEVIKINPRYTSQRCSKCGVIDKESRETQEVFECTTCGERTNADLNAARNIAMKGIEKIITDQLKTQK